jgi:lipoprotein-anchoring transpeptidase ErfK/SrfK
MWLYIQRWFGCIVVALCVTMSACSLSLESDASNALAPSTSTPGKPSATLPPTPVASPTALPTAPPITGPQAPVATGKVILIDLNQQWLWAFADGTLQFATPVTTGRPGMETPTGTFQVLGTLTETWFTSAWPPGSPQYFAPELVHYGLYFQAVGFYIHDASWRQQFGPGTNVAHIEPDGTRSTGSHGCVELSVAASQWLYRWAPVGTLIVITSYAPMRPPANIR